MQVKLNYISRGLGHYLGRCAIALADPGIHSLADSFRQSMPESIHGP